MIAQPYDTTSTPLQRRLVAASINCIIWLTGILILKWDTYEVHFLFLLDMSLFIIFSTLRILISLDNDASFFSSLMGRVYFGSMVLFTAGAMIVYICPVRAFQPETLQYLLHSPNRWTYSIMILNYFGYFIYDYLYTGFYKRSNPYVEGSADFVSILLMGIIVSIILNFITDSDHNQYLVLYGIAVVIGRFGSEIFLSVKSRTYFKNSDETESKLS